MDKINTDVFEAIADICKLSTDLVVMAAIWLEKPLQMADKRSIRITNGDIVWVAFGQLVDANEGVGSPYVITECRGTIYSTLLEIDVRDLVTNELLTIKL